MRKKLFAVIMSVMMMVTFMPAMAFADGISATIANVKFNESYTECTADLMITGATLPISTKSIKKSFGDDGKITAVANFANELAGYSETCADTKWNEEGDTYTATYYDLTGATLVLSQDFVQNGKIDSDKYLKEVYELDSEIYSGERTERVWTEEDGLATDIHLVKPEGVIGQASANAKMDDLQKKISLKVTPCDFEAYDTNGNYSFPVEINKVNNSIKDVIGSVSTSQEVYIFTPADSKLEHVKWNIGGKYVYSDDSAFNLTRTRRTTENWGYLSSSDNSSYENLEISTEYIAEDQVFEVSAKNVTVEYGVFDKQENDYVYSTTAPSVKDVKYAERNPEGAARDYAPYTFMVKVTKGNIKKTCKVDITVWPVKSKFGFKQQLFSFGMGEEIKVNDLVGFYINPDAGLRAGNDNSEPAVKDYPVYAADKQNIESVIEKLISVNGLFDQKGKGEIQLALDIEGFSDASAQSKKFEILKTKLTPEELLTLMNYSDFESDEMFEPAMLERTDKVNDVTAPNQTKTYHVKNAKALKKNQKAFQLKASADWGTLSFAKLSGNSKIRVAADGKVTVKKGLKKGKYVVKVKVKAPNAKAIKRLVVKVVK